MLGPELKSWRTTIIAGLNVLIILAGLIINVIDMNPETVADFNKAIVGIMAILNSLGLFAARDSRVSSQESGIRPETSKW